MHSKPISDFRETTIPLPFHYHRRYRALFPCSELVRYDMSACMETDKPTAAEQERFYAHAWNLFARLIVADKAYDFLAKGARKENYARLMGIAFEAAQFFEIEYINRDDDVDYLNDDS